MKKNFNELEFTDENTIDYWENLYDQKDFNAYCYKQRKAIVLSWLDGLGLSDNAIILDAGCGPGRFVCKADKRGYKVIGLDYSYGMLVKASSICKSEDELNAAFLQGDIQSMPFKPSSFDVIVCLGVIGYAEFKDRALDSFARALKPGGVLAISIVNEARLVSRLDLPLLLIISTKKILNGLATPSKKSVNPNNESRVKSYFIPNFRKSIERAGFRVLEYKTVPWKLLTFFGKEIFPQKMATKITLFFEQFSNIPVIGSFGGMCIFMAEKSSLRKMESGD